MIDLAAIQEAFATGNYQYTQHAVTRTTLRQISRQELEQAIAAGEIIEDYPNDKYGPTCLIYGKTKQGRPLHIQVSYPQISVKIITAYEPDPSEWDNNKVRK